MLNLNMNDVCIQCLILMGNENVYNQRFEFLRNWNVLQWFLMDLLIRENE
jgi:hypothetical protein